MYVYIYIYVNMFPFLDIFDVILQMFQSNAWADDPQLINRWPSGVETTDQSRQYKVNDA